MKHCWKIFASFLIAVSILTAVHGQEARQDVPRVLRVMTFNLWHGGDAGRQPLAQSAEGIKAARADIVGLQETEGFAKDGPRPDNGARLAALLGFHYFDQGGRRGILSRYPIVTNTVEKWGARIRLSFGQSVWVFNAHFAHAPYQPYQLLKIPYEGGAFLSTAAEAVNAAKAARGHQVEALLAELRGPLASGSPVFVTGDFNEPSHLDWTPAAAKAGLCPLAVSWPSTKALMDAGLADSFRIWHADEVKQRGWTWTPITREDDPKDRHDRIDFVFFDGRGTKLIRSELVGEKADRADIVVNPYPSDHRAVVSTFQLSP